MSSNSRVGEESEVTSEVRGRRSVGGACSDAFQLEEEPAGGDFDVDMMLWISLVFGLFFRVVVMVVFKV